MALVTLSRDVLAVEPDMRLLAAHARGVLAPRGGALTLALHAVRPMTLQGALDAVAVREDQRYAGVSVVTMRAGATSIDFPVPSGSVAERVLLDAPPVASDQRGSRD